MLKLPESYVTLWIPAMTPGCDIIRVRRAHPLDDNKRTCPIHQVISVTLIQQGAPHLKGYKEACANLKACSMGQWFGLIIISFPHRRCTRICSHMMARRQRDKAAKQPPVQARPRTSALRIFTPGMRNKNTYHNQGNHPLSTYEGACRSLVYLIA